MKLPGLLLLIMSFIAAIPVAHASFNEFECQFKAQEDKKVLLEIERPFGGTVTRNASMTVSSENNVEVHNFFVTAYRSRGFNRIEYRGANFDLEIDLWPDHAPRWGRTYRSDFRSWSLDDGRNYYNIDCRFTRI